MNDGGFGYLVASAFGVAILAMAFGLLKKYPVPPVEDRALIARLERQVRQLQSELDAARREARDWREEYIRLERRNK